MQCLAEAIKAQPDRRQKELTADFGVQPSPIHHACKRLGITRKKHSGAISKVTHTKDVSFSGFETGIVAKASS